MFVFGSWFLFKDSYVAPRRTGYVLNCSCEFTRYRVHEKGSEIFITWEMRFSAVYHVRFVWYTCMIIFPVICINLILCLFCTIEFVCVHQFVLLLLSFFHLLCVSLSISFSLSLTVRSLFLSLSLTLFLSRPFLSPLICLSVSLSLSH